MLIEYFDVTLIWKSDVPKIKLKLKDEKKIRTDIPWKNKENKIPFSSANKEYFVHYLGEQT